MTKRHTASQNRGPFRLVHLARVPNLEKRREDGCWVEATAGLLRCPCLRSCLTPRGVHLDVLSRFRACQNVRGSGKDNLSCGKLGPSLEELGRHAGCKPTIQTASGQFNRTLAFEGMYVLTGPFGGVRIGQRSLLRLQQDGKRLHHCYPSQFISPAKGNTYFLEPGFPSGYIFAAGRLGKTWMLFRKPAKKYGTGRHSWVSGAHFSGYSPSLAGHPWGT